MSGARFDGLINELVELKAAYAALESAVQGDVPVKAGSEVQGLKDKISQLERENRALKESVKILAEKRKKDKQVIELWKNKLASYKRPISGLPEADPFQSQDDVKPEYQDMQLATDETKLSTSQPNATQRVLAVSIDLDQVPSSPTPTPCFDTGLVQSSQASIGLTQPSLDGGNNGAANEVEESEIDFFSMLIDPSDDQITRDRIMTKFRARTGSSQAYIGSTRPPLDRDNNAAENEFEESEIRFPLLIDPSDDQRTRDWIMSKNKALMESRDAETPTLNNKRTLVHEIHEDTPVKRTALKQEPYLPTPVTGVRHGQAAGTLALSELLMRNWHPSDFIVNPNKNVDRLPFAFEEKLVGKARSCVHGTGCKSCQKFYDLMGNSKSDSTKAPKWLASKAASSVSEPGIMEVSSRHKSLWAPPESPPGFWRSDMASTQEHLNEKAQMAEKRDVEARSRLSYALVSGKYIFRDKILRDAAIKGHIYDDRV